MHIFIFSLPKFVIFFFLIIKSKASQAEDNDDDVSSILFELVLAFKPGSDTTSTKM